MADILANYIVPLAILGVFIALVLGIYSLAKGGEYARSHSNQLMRWRVGLQFLVILLLIITVYLKGNLSF
jgi:hypothetical protein